MPNYYDKYHHMFDNEMYRDGVAFGLLLALGITDKAQENWQANDVDRPDVSLGYALLNDELYLQIKDWSDGNYSPEELKQLVRNFSINMKKYDRDNVEDSQL